jgi:hypothetical protein
MEPSMHTYPDTIDPDLKKELSFTRQALQVAGWVAGCYLGVMALGFALVFLLKALLECRIATGIELSCSLFGVGVGSPLVPLGTALMMGLYLWPLAALAVAISLLLAAVFWLRSLVKRH